MKTSSLCLAFVALLPLLAAAQSDFPTRPVTLVVPFAAGGPSDKIARDLAEALRKPLGQTVIVENAAGAGGTIANAGLGSASHLCGLMLQSTLKVKMTPVPYKGTAPAMNDLIGGQVDIMCEQATNAVPQIEGRKVKPFAQTGLHRLSVPSLKVVPTLSEAGLPSFDVQVWHGLYAPKGTPPAVLAKVNAALRVALKEPELIKREEALGLKVINDNRLDPAVHRKFLDAEIARWGKVIREAGEFAD